MKKLILKLQLFGLFMLCGGILAMTAYFAIYSLFLLYYGEWILPLAIVPVMAFCTFGLVIIRGEGVETLKQEINRGN